MFSFNKSYFIDDLKAGLIVSLVALPLCLGIALASGAPLISGVIAGIIGGIIIGSLSNSHVSVSGPAAGLAVIVLGAIQDLGSFNVFLAAVIVAGAVQILMGLLKLGGYAKKIHHSVIEGMLASIGILIIIKQLPYAAGVMDFHGYSSIQWSTDYFNLGALFIGTACILSMIVFNTTSLKKFFIFKWIPFSIWLVLLGSMTAFLFKGGAFALLPQQFVNIGSAGEGASLLNILQYPDFSQILSWKVLKYGFIIAAVASIETLLCIEAGDKMDVQKRKSDANRELQAQGVGNMLSGFIGGLPITSVIVRTSVNIQSGAKTKFSAIIHGVILLVGLLLLPQLITQIPLVVLACILLNAGYNLANPKLILSMLKKSFHHFIPFFITIIFVVSKDLLMGVVIGQIIAVFLAWKWKEKNETVHE
ncbi:MAG: SulP family inorganic anion transporter [Bdellovibrionaceae bacterium]|nr:SulP family inorganic anion transporter [Pseudobdellovibrionaceae bacterium]